MSLIYANRQYSKYGEVYCEKCGAWCFAEEWNVLADMALRDVHVLCWKCDKSNSDTLPGHVYFLDETYLLGIGDKSFLMTWLTDDLEIKQGDLRATKISNAAWYDLKVGRVALLTKKRSTGIVARLGGCE